MIELASRGVLQTDHETEATMDWGVWNHLPLDTNIKEGLEVSFEDPLPAS